MDHWITKAAELVAITPKERLWDLRLLMIRLCVGMEGHQVGEDEEEILAIMRSHLADYYRDQNIPIEAQEAQAIFLNNQITKMIDDELEYSNIEFKRYQRPDDVGWAGWYSMGDETIGYLGLDKKFVPVQSP